MGDRYELRPGTPDVDSYLRLRADSGLTPKTREQAEAGLPGTWRGCHIVDTSTGDIVAMGRIIGDGGWYFHIVDMAVLPDHQRRGLGDRIMTWLLDIIESDSPPGRFVTLMADPPGRALYAKHGFTEQPELSAGMGLWNGRIRR